MSTWEIRRSVTRGALHAGWLGARFSFTFGDYDDPTRRRFGPLLALNDDGVQPGTGFPMHPHRDLEIVMLPLSRAIEHHDDRGGHAIVRPGQWQWMRAGSGIRHRQWNPSRHETGHHLQIWLQPSLRGLRPVVETVVLDAPEPGAWQAIVSREPGVGARDLNVDATITVGVTGPDHEPACDAHPGGRYLHVIDGPVSASADGLPPAPGLTPTRARPDDGPSFTPWREDMPTPQVAVLVGSLARESPNRRVAHAMARMAALSGRAGRLRREPPPAPVAGGAGQAHAPATGGLYRRRGAAVRE